ncbi:MAG: radical SAM protein [Planctomycetes bacterium]|nr:radical SAM protein [Planctomycetota bacterium]
MTPNSSFPITLVFPPQGHFTQPYLALPCLKAYLRANGFDDVELVDASVDAYDRFLSRDELARAARLVAERLPLARYANRTELSFRELAAFRAAAESAASAEALIARVDDAKAVIRGTRFWDMEQYVPAVRTLYHALRLFSAAHFPTMLTPHNFTMRYSIDRSRDVLAATLDEAENPFVRYFREYVLPGLVARKPRVLGMSVIYGSQLIPAMTLGRMIKRALPDCHVTAGGGYLAYIGQKLMQRPGVEECLDSLIFHEGEAPLLALCNALESGASLADVGALTWIDRSSGAPRAVVNRPGMPIRLDAAPLPDFEGLPLDEYFSPELVLPYDVNRGCYYGECSFCTLPTVIGPGYRTRRAKTIVEHVVQLKERHGARAFDFITDCMPPGMIRELPNELLRRDADIRWWSDARIEAEAYTEEGTRRLYASGCRKLLFGFETATPRLLDMMKKGQTVDETLAVAKHCARAGISVTFYAMVGFPTETRDEARATVDFLVKNANVIREVSLQTFHIDEVAETYQHPERFGLTIVDDPDLDIELYHDYVAETGMTQTEAAELFEEMMSRLCANLPLFSGDNIFYFMQKSHYFLHLARDMQPDEFVARCKERVDRRAKLGADATLAPSRDLRVVELPFSHTETRTKLAHPLARAIQPDFLTGRYVENRVAEAERALGTIAPKRKALAYDGDSAEFAELALDGKRVLEAIAKRGTLGSLLEGQSGASRAALERFGGELHRLGLLHLPHARTTTSTRSPSAAATTTL